MAILFDYTSSTTDFGEALGRFIYKPLVAPAYNLGEVVHEFWGLAGAAVHYSRPTVRELSMECTFLNYVSESALRSSVFTIQQLQGLDGSLAANGVTWPNVAFLGFQPSQEPFWDGSGQHGWVQAGQLRFRQIYPLA